MKNSKLKRALICAWRQNRGFIVFVVLMVLFRSSIADINRVPTGSMQPTIVEGDRIVVNKIAYDLQLPFSHTKLLKLGDPQRGDIVIFESKAADERLVKRIVGIPGDVVAMRANRVFINGQALNYDNTNLVPKLSPQSLLQDYLQLNEDLLGVKHSVRLRKRASSASSFVSVYVPEGYYLALGDNRDHSVDSRYIGLIPRHEIIGRSRQVLMSLDPENYYLPRSDRFAKAL